MQLYKESSTESQKVSPEPEIFRTTKFMRSDKVLLPNHNLKAQLKTLWKHTQQLLTSRNMSPLTAAFVSQHTKLVSLEETAPICTWHLDHCSCWILDNILRILSQEHFRSQEETCYSPLVGLHPGNSKDCPC